ncbi:MAG: arginine repressor [Oscillospiraceae bacterium]|jgi:transcriptional regulator of arginine metabolism|nr:arginine repressor [Oscillospiraceae bacterium]
MKTKRHAKILELVQSCNINTQEELQAHLKRFGFEVTQATVSRDIKELRLVKILNDDGNYRYAVTQDKGTDISSKFYSLFADAVLNVDYAVNMVVLKCHIGMAQAVCASIDAIHWQGIVGTLAGDDTIFIVARNEDSALNLTADFKAILHRR